MGWVIVVVKCASVGCFCIVWGGVIVCGELGVILLLVVPCEGVGCLYIGVTGCSCYVG